MRASFHALALGAALLVLNSLPAFAASQGDADAETLPTVVVTASAEPDDIRNIPANVRVISAKEIERTGAATFTDLLERTTAVRTLVQPGNYSRITLRGFSSGKSVGNTFSDQVLILIDGHRSGTGNINNLPVTNIERVEVLRGPASVLYGGSAVGGVVNVITKRGRGEVSGRVGAEAGTDDRYAGYAGLSGGADADRWGYAIGARMERSGDYHTGNGDRYVNSSYHKAGGAASLTFRPDPSASLSGVFAVHEIYDSGSPGDIYWSTPNSKMADSWMYGALELDKQFDSGVSLRASLYGNHNRYKDENREDWPYDSRFQSRMLGVRSVLGLPLPETALLDLGRLSIGAEYALHKQDLGGSSISEPDSTTNVYSLFAEHKFSPLSSLSVQYGLRYDYYNMETKRAGNLEMDTGSKNFQHLTWTGGATWWMLDWLGLRSSVGTAYVPPSSMQLTGKYTSWGITYKGNPDLKAEKSLTWDFGLEVEKGGLTASAGYFITRYKDRITTEITSLGYPTQMRYTNRGDQRIAGVEADARYTWTHDFKDKTFTIAPYGSLEYLTERSNRDDYSPTRRVTDLPRWTSLAGIGLGLDRLGPGLDQIWLDVNAQSTGKHTGYDFKDYKYREFGSYTLVNARLTVKPLKQLSVYGEVRNIGDKHYGYKPEFPLPGRTFTIGMSYEF